MTCEIIIVAPGACENVGAYIKGRYMYLYRNVNSLILPKLLPLCL